MASEKLTENLKKGAKTRFNGETAVENQKKSAASRKRNNRLRMLGMQMLSTPMVLDKSTLDSVKKLGFKTDAPELQMVILARLGALTTSKDPKIAMQAIDMIMEITGNDVRSINAEEQRKVERERISLEREKMEASKVQKEMSDNGIVSDILKAVNSIG